MGTIPAYRWFWLMLLLAATFVAVVSVPRTSAKAQTSQLSIVADKGGYTVGDTATVRVSGLNECAGQTVRLGFRSLASGAAISANEVPLDAGGNGSTQLTLTSDNGGAPIQAAAWGDCVSRGLETGLALDPHPILISIVPLPPATGNGLAAHGLTREVALLAGFLLVAAGLAGILLAAQRADDQL